jgi:hypothetical protein
MNMNTPEVESWVKMLAIATNDRLSLVSSGVLERLLAESALEPIIHCIDGLGVMSQKRICELAEMEPHLPEMIGAHKIHNLVEEWCAENEEFLKTCRRFCKALCRGMRNNKPAIAWDVDSLPNNGGIYEILLRGGRDEKGSNNNQG